MSYQNPRSHNGMMGPQVRRGIHRNVQGGFPPVHPNVLHEEIQRMGSLLEMERAHRFEDNQRLAQLEAELEETKLQLKRQKALKEVFINKGKETKRELERIEKLSDPAVVNAAILASKVHNDMKYKNKKMLQQDFVELKMAHLLSQEAFTSEIQAEKEKSKTLQEELNKLQTSHEELCSKYESDVALVRQEAEMQKICEVRVSEVQMVLENLRAEKDNMFQKMSEEIAFLQSSENSLQAELDQVKRSYEELNQKYERDVSGLKAQVETYDKELEREREASSDRAKKDLKEINKLREDRDYIYESMTKEFTFLQISEHNLQVELDQVKLSYEELGQKYERDVSGLKAQVETYDKELEREREASSDRAKKDLEQINKLREDRDYIYESMTKEFTFLQISEHNLQVELDQVKLSYEELGQKYERDVSGLKAQVETYEKELEREREASSDRAKKDLEQINKLREDRDYIYESMTKEFTFLQISEHNLQVELDQVKRSYEELDQKYERDVSGLKAQVETYEKELEREREASSDRARKDDLEQTYKLKCEAMSKEVQALQQKFNKITKDLKCNMDQCETSHFSLKQQVEKLQIQIIQETKAHLEDMVLLNNMKAINATLRENTAKEIELLQEKERDAQTELEKIQDLYQVLHCRYETDVAALKQEVEKYQQVSCERNINLERAYEDLEFANSRRDEKEDLEQKTPQEFTDFQEKEKESQPDHFEVLHQEVSSEEDFSEQTSSGCPPYLESIEMIDFAAGSIPENLDNMQDGKRKKPKLSVWKRIQNFMRLKKSKKQRKE